MSSRTKVPVGASLQRYAISDVATTDDGVAARVHVALWEGHYSQGYKSNYTPVPTRWLVIEARDAQSCELLRYNDVSHTPRRLCKSFSGQRFPKALRDFETIVKRDKLAEPGPGDAHRYYHRVNGSTRGAVGVNA